MRLLSKHVVWVPTLTTNEYERQNPYRVEKQFISALETDKTTETETSAE